MHNELLEKIQQQLTMLAENMATKEDLERLAIRITDVRDELKSDIGRVELQIEHAEEKLSKHINQLDEDTQERFNQVMDAIGGTLTAEVQAVDTRKQVQDHEHRIARLERRVA